MEAIKRRFVNIIVIALFVSSALFLLGGDKREVRAGTKDVYKNIEIFTEVLTQIEKIMLNLRIPKS
jgi:carboxyl-terminal processing protease